MMKKMAPVSDRMVVFVAVETEFGLLNIGQLANRLTKELEREMENLNETLEECFSENDPNRQKWVVIQTETNTTREGKGRVMTCTAICETRPYQP